VIPILAWWQYETPHGGAPCSSAKNDPGITSIWKSWKIAGKKALAISASLPLWVGSIISRPEFAQNGSHTHRYTLTDFGRQTITALLAARNANSLELAKLAA
jgi:hypothetical protein